MQSHGKSKSADASHCLVVLYDHMMDRSVRSAEVVKALWSLVNSVHGHFRSLKKTEVNKD